MIRSPSRVLLMVVVIHCISFAFPTDAYRIGDAVGILLRTHTPSDGGATLEAYRHQLPRFGVSTKTRFTVSSLLDADDIRLSEDATSQNNEKYNDKNKLHRREADAPNEHLRLSLSFDDGFHHIPWLDVYNPTRRDEKVLENVRITIVYSGSDGGIHAVHRETKYREDPKRSNGRAGPPDMPESFTVEYVWVNEADVDIQGGLLALLVAVLVVSLSGLVGACASSADEGDGRAAGGPRSKERGGSSSWEAGSSVGFAKRL